MALRVAPGVGLGAPGRRGGRCLFQKSEFGLATGGAPASSWLVGAVAQPKRGTKPRVAGDWAARFREWSEDVDLIPDLGRNIGSPTWLRGLATLLALLAAAFALAPGFDPLPGRAPDQLVRPGPPGPRTDPSPETSDS